MSDADKITAILEYVQQFKKFDFDKEYPQDIQSDCGGNFDDAYALGMNHGERDVATNIMEILGV